MINAINVFFLIFSMFYTVPLGNFLIDLFLHTFEMYTVCVHFAQMDYQKKFALYVKYDAIRVILKYWVKCSQSLVTFARTGKQIKIVNLN